MNKQPKEEEGLNEFVRDMCDIVPRPKSYVRKRMQDLIDKSKKEERERIKELIKKNREYELSLKGDLYIEKYYLLKNLLLDEKENS